MQIPAEINVSDMLTKVQSGTKVKRYIDLINPIKIIRRWLEEEDKVFRQKDKDKDSDVKTDADQDKDKDRDEKMQCRLECDSV